MAGWAFVAGMVFGFVLGVLVLHALASRYANRRRARVRAWWDGLSAQAQKEHVQRIAGAIPVEALPDEDRERIERARAAIHRGMHEVSEEA